MKIVQSFWTNGGLTNTYGWLSPEYHWMSWALSVLQLRQFYDEVELVTDDLGKHILIDVLQLPYTSVRTDLQTAMTGYPKELWALSKIYAYSLQKEPFLHIDGDIFIWKRFEERIEKAALVAQNFEIDFPFYRVPLQTMQNEFENVPSCMLDELERETSIFSSNTGIIGGHQLPIFEEYRLLAFGIINDNFKNLSKVEIQHFNICFEQFLYYCLSKEKGMELSYVIDNQGQFDPTYPGFANFHTVPYDTWFVHLMADYKRQESVVNHLSKRLRQDYPTYYYRILRICQSAGVELLDKLYTLPELSPSLHDDAYFEQLKNYQLSEPQSPSYFYGKGMVSYPAVQQLFSLPFEDIIEQKIVLDKDIIIEEETEPELRQTLRCFNLFSQKHQELALDNLNMILYDAFLEPKSINNAIVETGAYFPKEDLKADYGKFQNLVLDRIKEGLYMGSLAWLREA